MYVTPTCVKAAAHVLDNLHPNYKSMDPCDDFAQCMHLHLIARAYSRANDMSRLLRRVPNQISNSEIYGNSG